MVDGGLESSKIIIVEGDEVFGAEWPDVPRFTAPEMVEGIGDKVCEAGKRAIDGGRHECSEMAYGMIGVGGESCAIGHGGEAGKI